MPERSPQTPQWTPSQRELDDLDVLVNRALGADHTGFVDPASDALPLTITVDSATAEAAASLGSLELIDPEGAPLALLEVTARYAADNGRVGLVGPVTRLAHNEFGPFRRLYRSPEQVHAEHSHGSLLAVPVSRALTDRDTTRIGRTADDAGLTPLLLVLTGSGTPDGLSVPALIRAALVAAELIEPSPLVVAVSLADHGPAANPALHEAVASAYGSKTLTLDAGGHGQVAAAIAEMVEREHPPRDRQGAVIFFTGLSGSGKSTLARALVDHVLEQGERTITSLDGDVVRHHLSKGLGYSREDRETNILRIGYVAAEISRHGGLAICSPIAPFESTRAEVRRMVEAAGGGFVLIHVSTPLEECERRDRKGLYAKARRGEIPDFTGISSPYEEPREALKIDTTNRDIAECLRELTDALVAAGWLRA